MIKRRHAEESENHERWLVSYADFITLLFAFFVVMYATSNNDQQKQKEFQESVRTELKIVTVHKGGSGESQGPEQALNELEQLDDQFPRRGGPAEVQDYVERQLKKKMNSEEMQKAGIQVRRDAAGARVTLAAASFFSSGETKLKRESLQALDKVAEVLALSDRKIMIEGHTDDQPFASDSYASNWELASLRATTVVRYLSKIHHIKPARLAAVSYADQKPLVANNNEENRARNRRIEILITTDFAEE